jgi:endoglucanase
MLDAVPSLPPAERHVDAVRAAGFDTVRLPVRWSAHAEESAPYRIAPAFFAQVDEAVEHALGRDLTVVLNVHHYHELMAAPADHEARFLALWRQVAARYSGRPARLIFELLNEPRDAVTPEVWNRLLRRALATVREYHPDRTVIAGPARMNALDALPELDLPADDRLITTIHHYAPFPFTHQGAPWVAGADRWLGTTWGGAADVDAVRADLAKAAAWAREHRRQLFVGEFGAYDAADAASRVRWTAAVRTEAERFGLSWCYWDFATDFGAYDPARDAWHEPLRAALLGN